MRVELDPFEERYRAVTDPWDFASSPYEQHRYDIVEQSLGDRRYERCFEPGCSVGSLTERLAARADIVIASDTSPSALATASKRLARFDNVRLVHGAIPEAWPKGLFDLIVFAELGYYWDVADLGTLAAKLASSVAAGGDLVAVHWLGDSSDHLLKGRVVHDVLATTFGPAASRVEEPNFVLERWRR